MLLNTQRTFTQRTNKWFYYARNFFNGSLWMDSKHFHRRRASRGDDRERRARRLPSRASVSRSRRSLAAGPVQELTDFDVATPPDTHAPAGFLFALSGSRRWRSSFSLGCAGLSRCIQWLTCEKLDKLIWCIASIALEFIWGGGRVIDGCFLALQLGS